MRITVIAAGFDEVAPRLVSRGAGFAPSPAVPVTPVTVEPVVEPEVVLQTESNWFGARTGGIPTVENVVVEDVQPPVEVVPEPVLQIQGEETRRETGFFGRRRESKKFDDGFDMPDFLND